MTGIDLLVGMMLMGCVEGEPVKYKEQEHEIEVQVYVCPLIGHEAEFVVWRRVCPIEEDRPAFAFQDRRDGRGWVHNQFAGIDPAFVNVDAFPIYLPPCQ